MTQNDLESFSLPEANSKTIDSSHNARSIVLGCDLVFEIPIRMEWPPLELKPMEGPLEWPLLELRPMKGPLERLVLDLEQELELMEIPLKRLVLDLEQMEHMELLVELMMQMFLAGKSLALPKKPLE